MCLQHLVYGEILLKKLEMDYALEFYSNGRLIRWVADAFLHARQLLANWETWIKVLNSIFLIMYLFVAYFLHFYNFGIYYILYLYIHQFYTVEIFLVDYQ